MKCFKISEGLWADPNVEVQNIFPFKLSFLHLIEIFCLWPTFLFSFKNFCLCAHEKASQ